MQTRRNDEKPDLYQVFGRVHNYRGAVVKTEAQLWRHTPDQPGKAGTLIEPLPSRSRPSPTTRSSSTSPTRGRMSWRSGSRSPTPWRSTTARTPWWATRARRRCSSSRRATATWSTPFGLPRLSTGPTDRRDARRGEERPVRRDVRSGRYDLLIYDRYRPETAPEANALYFGVLPPGPAYAKSHPIDDPVILDWDVAHPLMQFVRDLPTVGILKAIGVEPHPAPPADREQQGPLAFIAPREGFTDTVVTFPLMEGENFNTNWFRNISFPLFLFNASRSWATPANRSATRCTFPASPYTSAPIHRRRRSR